MIIANMMASCPDYGKYSEEVLSKQMNSRVLAEVRDLEAKGDYANPRYIELMTLNYYEVHLCRLRAWPDPLMRTLKHHNRDICNLMQGPSEFGVGGNLADWNIKDRLKEIRVPTLMVGARFDTMDPKAMEEQSKKVQRGRYLYCPNGSHMCMWDDQQVFMNGVIKFIKDVDSGKF
jgi:proline iminopeptidase